MAIMRSPMLLVLAALCYFVDAHYIRWPDDGAMTSQWIATETGTVAAEAATAWAPKPTSTPAITKNELFDGLNQRQEATNTWINDQTCGWIAEISSMPFTCGGDGTCVTNSKHVIACATGTLSPYYEACLDYVAYQGGSCVNENTSTGCCFNTDYGKCETLLWIDEPQRSMYQCAKVAAVVTMMDVPQFVVDASISYAAAIASASVSIALTLTSDATSTAAESTESSHPDIPEPLPSSPVSKGFIAGIVLGGITLLSLAGYATASCYKHRRGTAEEHKEIRDRLDRIMHASPQRPAPPVRPARSPVHEPVPAATPLEPPTPRRHTVRRANPEPPRSPASTHYESMPSLPSMTPYRRRMSLPSQSSLASTTSTSMSLPTLATPPPRYSRRDPHTRNASSPDLRRRDPNDRDDSYETYDSDSEGIPLTTLHLLPGSPLSTAERNRERGRYEQRGDSRFP
ncbi:hypothetical protein F4677DRAFT_459709 [Hypoxylon crocopeplum]|nr:hypothetical protein F4677DRAFT_459709 [Hypoxylon crocopeplum]